MTAAKIVGETARVHRFRSKDAFARHNGTAPLPVWSSNKQRHRLSRTGNRQLNAALHRIAMTQARLHPPARELMHRGRHPGMLRVEVGQSGVEPGQPFPEAAPRLPQRLQQRHSRGIPVGDVDKAVANHAIHTTRGQNSLATATVFSRSAAPDRASRASVGNRAEGS